MFYLLSALSLFLFVVFVFILSSLSNRDETTRTIVQVRQVLQYVSLSMLSFTFISGILGLQESGHKVLETYNDYSLLSDLVFWSFLFLIIIIYNIRVIKIFCKPIFTASISKSLHNFILYLRSFNAENTQVTCILKQLEKQSFKSVAIADPHVVIQNSFSDGVYADDDEWKNLVLQLMKKSAYIILQVGNTNGCLWELEHCDEQYIGKTLFIVSNIQSFDVFKSFVESREYNHYHPLPEYKEGSVQVFFLPSPDNVFRWSSFDISCMKDVEHLLNNFCDNRQNLLLRIRTFYKAKNAPYKSLFNDDLFPKDFGWLSWAGFSILAFPFIGGLRFAYWSVLFLLTVIMFVIIGQPTVYVMVILISIFGKRMIWLSGKWSGTKAVEYQINLVVIIGIICIAMSVFLGRLYLSIYPIA